MSFTAPRFTATATLVAVNTAIYIAMLSGADTSLLHLSAARVAANPWTAFTYMFTHASTIHFAANVILLAVAGAILEHRCGPAAVVLSYIIGGIAGGLLFVGGCHLAATSEPFLTGASAATLSVCAATLATTPAIIARIKESKAAIGGIAMMLFIVLWGLGGKNPGGALAHAAGIVCGLAVALVIMRRHKPAAEPADQAEIIDKARRSGYSSLSDEERKKLTTDNTRQ